MGSVVCAHLQTLFLSELRGEDLGLDVGLEPVHHLVEILIGVGNLFAGQELLERLQNAIVYLKVAAYGAICQILPGEVEESVTIQQHILEVVILWRIDPVVGRDAAAAIHGAARIGQLDFAVGRVLRLIVVVSSSRRAKRPCSCAGSGARSGV